ncbi:MAG: hypothetical protein ACI865_000047 [Flavobacteriaceae bacterium]|jgi:hypothetical protein
MKKLAQLTLLIVIAFAFVQCTETATVESADNSAVVKNDETVVETPLTEAQLLHDKIGKFLAGIKHDNLGNANAFNSDKWDTHSKLLSGNWASMETKRLTPMSDWTKSTINPNIIDTLPLFYPYSGPDFLHANYLFPNASNYTMMALEPIGDLPDFATMSQGEMDHYLDNINLFLRDIYKRSYFITKNMEGDVDSSAINGILPVLYVFIERSGYSIKDVERVGLDASGNIVAKENGISNKLDGVRFSMTQNETGQKKQLVYWDCNISNSGFEKTPELALYISNMQRSNAFMKSASYLMHYNTFSEIRELVLANSQAILEDDTGIPYKYFESSQWKALLYGKYTKPIADFQSRLWQEDLQEAYDDPATHAGTLPFSLGYHWGDGVQNYMLYVNR